MEYNVDLGVEATLKALRDTAISAGLLSCTTCSWYYPPTVLNEDGHLWGPWDDHLTLVRDNRSYVRHFYRSLQPDAPVPGLLNRSDRVATVESFAAYLLWYYRPLTVTPAPLGTTTELIEQTTALLSEANVLYNTALAMRRP